MALAPVYLAPLSMRAGPGWWPFAGIYDHPRFYGGVTPLVDPFGVFFPPFGFGLHLIVLLKWWSAPRHRFREFRLS